LPVSASIATIEADHSLSPARSAPFQSGAAFEVEKNSVFVFGSTVGVFQMPAPPWVQALLFEGQVL
jgi:hypothetical protein